VEVGKEWKGFLKRALDQLLREQLNRQDRKQRQGREIERARKWMVSNTFEHVQTRSDAEVRKKEKMI